MSDPATDSSDAPISAGETGDAVAEESPVTSESLEAETTFELVTDAYIRVNEVLYGWAKWLNPWQVNAVKALTNPNALTHPEHPLFDKEQGGLLLFNCVKADGHENLSFSLKQIEYIQYYIHEMRLADPAWTLYLGKLSSANAEDQPKPGEVIAPPPYVEEENPWVPMPSAVVRAAGFSDIEPIIFTDAREIKRFLNSQAKRNKAADRKQLLMRDISAEERNRLEAEIDNEAPGPGLRKGPPKRHERKSDIRHERQPGTGWGGFPLGDAKSPAGDGVLAPKATEARDIDTGTESVAAPPEDSTSNPRIAIAHGTNDTAEAAHPSTEGDPALSGPQDRSSQADNQVTQSAHVDEPNAEPAGTGDVSVGDADPDELAKHLTKLSELSAKLADEGMTSNRSTADETSANLDDPLEQYYHDAQQAFLLASAGGLAEALAAKAEDEDASAGEKPEVPKEIGRSLFIALNLVTWEEDENAVLEVGWAASWWQEKLPSESDSDEGRGEAKEEYKGEADDGDRFERMTDHGHIVIQDHLLDKRNGKVKPDDRSAFAFGTSLPLPGSEANRIIKDKLRDLSKRAGGGPIYFLLHSADSTESEFKKIGWKTSNWEKQIRPAGWEYPSYASQDAVGKVFILDTAVLFGAVEDDHSIQPALGRTRKSLETVAQIMFGGVPDEAPQACGNAGNYAAYCMRVFLAIVDGPRLEILRADYRQSQLPIAVDPKLSNDGRDETRGLDPDDEVETVKRGELPVPDSKDAFAQAMAMKSESRVENSSRSTVTSPDRDQPMTPAEFTETAAQPLRAAQAGKGKVHKEVEKEDDEDEGEDHHITAVYYEDADGKMVEL